MYPHHKNTYLPILPVLELLSYKLGGECTSRYETVWLCVELQEAFVSHPQHKEQMWSRGSEKRRRAEDGTSKGRQCWDPPLLRAAGTPKYERLWGQPSSARQRVSLPCLGFLLHLSLPCHPSSPLHSLGRWASHLTGSWTWGKKLASLLSSAVLVSLNLMTAWPAQLSWVPGLPEVQQPERMAWDRRGGGRW